MSAFPIEQYDKELFGKLLAPLIAECTERKHFNGFGPGFALLRAGLVLIEVGVWLLKREGVGDLSLTLGLADTQAAVQADIAAITESIITREVGTPYPLVEPQR